MLMIDTVLIAQALLGAFDNLWHHEWAARLPQQRGARRELALHAAREALYGALFLGLGWWAWHGAWAALVAAVLGVEVVITLSDFLEEDRTRTLPPFERWLHTVLTVSYGCFLGLFGPVLWAWWHQPTGLVPAGRGWVSVLYTLFAVGVWLWSARNLLAVLRLGRETPEPTPPLPRGAETVLVTGGTGFVGRTLVRRLRAQGHRVLVLSRDVKQARAQLGDGVTVIHTLDEILPETRLHAIVHLAGARVLGRPWTLGRREVLQNSRTRLTESLRALVQRLEHRPAVLVAASAVGFYGTPPEDVLCCEQQGPMPGTYQSDLCAAIEHEAMRLEALGLRVVRMRFGVILGRDDGALPMQALAARWGFAARLGSGRQALPWIHLDDAVGMVLWALRRSDVRGAVNGVAPDLHSQWSFTQALATSVGRRARLWMPAAPLRALAGEMSTLLLDGQRVWPARALAGGYRFRWHQLDAALLDLMQAPRAEDSADEPAHHPTRPTSATTATATGDVATRVNQA